MYMYLQYMDDTIIDARLASQLDREPDVCFLLCIQSPALVSANFRPLSQTLMISALFLMKTMCLDLKTLVYETMSNNVTLGSLLLMKLSRFVLFRMGNVGLAAAQCERCNIMPIVHEASFQLRSYSR